MEDKMIKELVEILTELENNQKLIIELLNNQDRKYTTPEARKPRMYKVKR